MSMLKNILAAFPGHPRSPFYGKPLIYMPGSAAIIRRPGAVRAVASGCGAIGGPDDTFMVCDPNGPIATQIIRAAALGYGLVELGFPDHMGLGEFMELLTQAHGVGIGVIAKNPSHSPGPFQFVSHPNVFGIVAERGIGDVASLVELRHHSRKDGLMPIWFVYDGPAGVSELADHIRRAAYTGIGVSFGSGLGRTKYDDSIAVLDPIV